MPARLGGSGKVDQTGPTPGGAGGDVSDMSSLAWRRRTQSEQPAPEPEASEEGGVWPVLAELEVTTAGERIRGWFAPEGERASDWVNHAGEIELLAPVNETPSADVPALAPPPPDPRRARVPVERVLFLVPPPLPSGRHLRLHRRVSGIHFEMGPYEIHGRIHVRPGAQVRDYLLRSNRTFVPITDAELVHTGEPAFRRRVGVLIVNSRHVTRLYAAPGEAVSASVTGHATAAPPRPAPSQAAPASANESNRAQPAGSAGPESVDDAETDPAPVPGAIHQALAELAALRADDLVSEREYRAKRREILARL